MKKTIGAKIMISIGAILICLGFLAILGGWGDSDVIIGAMVFIIPGGLLLGFGMKKKRKNVSMTNNLNQEIKQDDMSKIEPTVVESNTEKVETNNKRNIVVGIVAGLAIATIIICILDGGSNASNVSSAYYDSIVIDNNSGTGAVFNYSFSDVKSIVGSNLSIGDLNSSSGGWNQISSTSTYTEYNIVATGGVWAVNVGVDSNDNVFSIVCKTVGLDNGSPNDSEIESFASVFAEIIGTTPDSTYSVLKDLCASSNQTRTYDQGVQITYQKTSGGSCCFGITAMSEEYWNSIQ